MNESCRNFGRVLFALSPQEVSSLPAESYEDIVQAASTAKGLTEGQVLNVLFNWFVLSVC